MEEFVVAKFKTTMVDDDLLAAGKQAYAIYTATIDELSARAEKRSEIISALKGLDAHVKPEPKRRGRPPKGSAPDAIEDEVQAA